MRWYTVDTHSAKTASFAFQARKKSVRVALVSSRTEFNCFWTQLRLLLKGWNAGIVIKMQPFTAGSVTRTFAMVSLLSPFLLQKISFSLINFLICFLKIATLYFHTIRLWWCRPQTPCFFNPPKNTYARNVSKLYNFACKAQRSRIGDTRPHPAAWNHSRHNITKNTRKAMPGYCLRCIVRLCKAKRRWAFLQDKRRHGYRGQFRSIMVVVLTFRQERKSSIKLCQNSWVKIVLYLYFTLLFVLNFFCEKGIFVVRSELKNGSCFISQW